MTLAKYCIPCSTRPWSPLQMREHLSDRKSSMQCQSGNEVVTLYHVVVIRSVAVC